MNYSDQTEQFRNYLKGQRFAPETTHKYSRMLLSFLEWQEAEAIEKVEYADLLTFIRYCQGKGKSTVRVNKYLLAVRHYIDHQIKEGKETTNPAIGLQIRGAQQKVKQGLLNRKELDELEQRYIGKHKLILSLIIHQALTLSELEKLEPSHLDLHQGTIYVPAGRKSNSRTLKLQAHQVMELMKAKENNTGNPSTSSGHRLVSNKPLKNTGHGLCKELKRINEKVRNLRQLRGSVISDWLKADNLRVVQYKAGHKHVMSTEKYLQQDLEGLKEQLKKHHPLG